MLQPCFNFLHVRRNFCCFASWHNHKPSCNGDYNSVFFFFSIFFRWSFVVTYLNMTCFWIFFQSFRFKLFSVFMQRDYSCSNFMKSSFHCNLLLAKKSENNLRLRTIRHSLVSTMCHMIKIIILDGSYSHSDAFKGL